MPTVTSDALETTTVTATPSSQFSGESTADSTATMTGSLDAIRTIALLLEGFLTVSAAPVANQEYLVTALSTILTASVSFAEKAVFAIASESATVTEALTPNAILQLLATEGASIVAVLVIDGEEYVVWVANADTFAHSQYANFNFNSMARIGGKYYGAKDEGIFLLEGADDAGTDIQYFMTLPTTDFGTSKQKRVPKLYMGFSTAGDMHLKMITREGIARVYAMSKLSEGYSESGAAPGRKVKSRYFTFDFYNVEGGDAKIEHIEFFPVILSRLINS